MTYVSMNRTAEFNAGLTGGTDIASSFNQTSEKQNAMNPGKFTPQSVLQPYVRSANGMSPGDYARVIPGGGTLPTMNGSSPSTYDKLFPKFGANLGL